MLDGLISLATSTLDKVVTVVPAQAAIMGVMQLIAGKCFKMYTKDDVPNEFIVVVTIATSMLGYMLVASGANPEWGLKQLAETSIWPAMQQSVAVTGVHSASKNAGKIAKAAGVAVQAALNAVPGGTFIGTALKFLGFKKK